MLAAALLGCGSGSEAPGGVDAIFLIVVDTLRADQLSVYGNTQHATPHIDALARRGVLFERVQSAASWTRPAMAALFTSQYPSELGLVEAGVERESELAWRDPREQRRRALPVRTRTLAEQLALAGFTTAAFVNQPVLGIEDSGFRRGFDAWVAPQADGEIVRYAPTQPALPQSRDLREAHSSDAALVEEFGRWADAAPDGPVFVWLHLLTPHRPYASWPSGEALPTGPQVRADVAYAGRSARRGCDRRACTRSDRPRGSVSSAAWWVVTSDHGEEFGEHAMFEHGHSLHREVLEVPLIVAAPGYPAGARVQANVRSVDILPTLLELAGRPDLVPDTTHGRSLTKMLVRDEGRESYSEGIWYGSTERSLLAGGYKLMFDAQDESWRLFDVVSDPGETQDLAQRQPERTARLRQRLETSHADAVAAAKLEPAAHAGGLERDTPRGVARPRLSGG